MDRARKGPVLPLRSVIIGPPSADPPRPPASTPPSGNELTRLFRMTPQDPAAADSREPSVVTPRMEDQQTLPRMESVTRFFSADELLSRGEKLGPRGLGSGEFEMVKPHVGSSPHAARMPAWPAAGDATRPGVPRNTLPIGTVPGATSSPPPARDPAPTSRSAVDEPVKLPYVWGTRLRGAGGLSARRLFMVLLAVAAAVVFIAGPELRERLAPRRDGAASAPSGTSLVAAGTAVKAASPAAGPTSVTGAAPLGPGSEKAAPAATSSAASTRAPAPTTLVAANPTTAKSGPSAVGRAELGVPGHGATAERAAIDAVAEGRYAAALDLYRRLVTDDPSRQSFKDAVRILTARLTAPQ